MGGKFSKVEPLPGDFAWDKMNGRRCVILEEDRNNPSNWLVDTGCHRPTPMHKNSLTTEKPYSRKWYLLWLA